MNLLYFILILNNNNNNNKYISNVLWKYLFNKVADNLERSTENEDECNNYNCCCCCCCCCC